MREKKSVSTGVGVGGSSILVIFILLCLTTFATLSMVSARADLRLTEKTVQATQEYYAADAQAERILADIDRVLLAQRDRGALGADYLDACMRSIPQEVDGVETVRGDGGAYLVQYRVPLNAYHQLAVELTLKSTGGDERYLRSAWRVETIGDWEPEAGGFDLWGPSEDEMQLAGDGLPFDLAEMEE